MAISKARSIHYCVFILFSRGLASESAAVCGVGVVVVVSQIGQRARGEGDRAGPDGMLQARKRRLAVICNVYSAFSLVCAPCARVSFFPFPVDIFQHRNDIAAARDRERNHGIEASNAKKDLHNSLDECKLHDLVKQFSPMPVTVCNKCDACTDAPSEQIESTERIFRACFDVEK